MLQMTIATMSNSTKALLAALRVRYLARSFAVYMGLLIVFLAITSTKPVFADNVGEFFKSMTGDWIGTCKQSTDGKQADDKYFHASVKQIGPNIYETKFEYYRLNSKTGEMVRAGGSTVTTTISQDGQAKSRITGNGQILVNNSPKNQKHDLMETLSFNNEGLQGNGTGTLSVSGMPMGLGKNGKVRNDKSIWSINDGILTIRQSLDVSFRAIFFSKSFSVVANYTAKRGTNVACLAGKSAKYSGSANGAGKRS